MSRIPTFTAFLAAIVVLAAMVGAVGCSNGSSITSPESSGLTANASPAPSSSGGLALGYFQFVFGDDGTVTVEETEPIRGADLNVTKFASVVIENFFFDEAERNWYITATIKNISPFTGYDVLAVFHSLGGKFITNQDGFVWALPPIFPQPTRCAFIAYGKDTLDRVYTPMYQDTRTIIMHQPDGVPRLAPLGFWIEGYAQNRNFPGVEDLEVKISPKEIYPPEYDLKGYVWDHQSPSSDLIVWADCTGFNGQENVPMFDDGQHNDGLAGDDIWGCAFSGDPEDGYYVITVYAYDPEQNKGENDVGFWEGAGAPCDLPFEYFPFETIAKGEQSGIQSLTEMVINDPLLWEQTWAQHTSYIIPPPPIPPIDFEKHTVIGVWLGPRPSNNHMVTITDVYLDPCEGLVTALYDYSPYESCGSLDVMTYPFHIVVLPKFEWPVYFSSKEVGCPPPPPECAEEIPFETLAQGPHDGLHEPYERFLTNAEDFNALWLQHTKGMYPAPPPPDIDWANRNVVAVGLGDRPTGGFECIIDKICILTNQQLGIFYRERIPGPDCPVPDIITQPHHWVVLPKTATNPPELYFKHHEVYNCGNEDCQEPLMFYTIEEGTDSGHEPGEFVIKNHQDWFGFYSTHHPGMTPPPINFEEQMLLAMLIGERPSTGYIVQTNEVCLNTSEDGALRIDVKYTEHQPGQNCNVEWIETHPYQIVVVPKFECPVFFHKTVDIYDCPGGCVPMQWQPLENGDQSCDEPGEWGLWGFGDAFKDHWWKVHCWDDSDPGNMPPVPPAEPGFSWIPFTVTLPEQPSTGYYMEVTDVCIEGCDVYVKYVEYVPGVNCPVDWVITKPWAFWLTQLPDIDCEYIWHFEKSVAVYNCDPPCEPVPFYLLEGNDGIQSCMEPGEYGFQYMDGYENFWSQVHCGMPPVPPLPKDPEPIQNGVIYHFGIQLSDRPTTGYYMTIDNVCINGCDVYIDYTENIPGPNCVVQYVTTKPWIVAAVELPAVYCYWTWHFNKHEIVYDCVNPCWEFYTIASGDGQSTCEPGGWFFDNYASYHQYWVTYHSGEPMPPIDFNQGWGGYAIHLGSRPTSGYMVDVYEVCQSKDPFGAAVRWIESIPGETCEVLPVTTCPWTLVTFPLVDLPYFDEGHEEIYQCD